MTISVGDIGVQGWIMDTPQIKSDSFCIQTAQAAGIRGKILLDIDGNCTDNTPGEEKIEVG